MAIVLGSMLVPFVVVAIPLFIMMANMKWLNNFLALIVPFMAPAFGIFMMTQYMQSLPDELIDAARIDGSSDFGIYWRIVVPLIRPALGRWPFSCSCRPGTLFLAIVGDEYPTNYTLPMGLGSIRGENFKMENMGRVLAGSALISAPWCWFS
jgi:ABC-type glycerol-3-phosphate transport system permease component